MRQDNVKTAAICGLFCGTCPAYPNSCGGCLSDYVAPGCYHCANGFRDCAARHNVTRCYECEKFPCDRLEDFSRRHIVNGICHHAHVIDDLRRMQEVGVEAWAQAQNEAHTCAQCGKLIPWFEQDCPQCKE